MTLAWRPDLWLPPLALMGLIFFLSAQPDLSSGLGVWDTILRKIAHATVFGALFFLWWRLFRQSGLESQAVVAAMIVTVAYAATDEWHQTFVEGRHGSPLDVLIDTAGATVVAAFVTRRA